jgi:succinate dehydrogenase / fumarate reductase membrane anchor subunit
MSMETPLRRVLHYGAGHDGTGHFWRQRLTGVANAILVVFFLGLLVAVVGKSHGEVAAVIGSPVVAALLVLFIVSFSIHMRLGMQTIIEDYIHGEALKVVCLVANTFFSFLVGAAGLLAVLKLALGG